MSENQNPLVKLIDSKKNEIWNLRSHHLDSDVETYFKKALYVIKDDKSLIEMSKTPQGAESILMAINKTLQLGLQFGGLIPQAHLVGFKGKDGPKVEVIVTADGYRTIAMSTPAVITSLITNAVFDNESFSINYADASVVHSFDGKGSKGEFVGVYGIITDFQGCKKVEYMTREEIEKIRDQYSKTWKYNQSGPWKTEPVMMALKTATKRFLKPYAALKEGLANAMNIDDDNYKLDNQNPDIEDRMSTHLDNMPSGQPEDIEIIPEEVQGQNEPAKEDENLF